MFGRDIATISHRKTLEVIIGILNSETGNQSRYRLIEDMVKDPENFDYDFEEILKLLESLKIGLLERSKKV